MFTAEALRPLDKKEASAAAGVMSRAFARDPFTLHISPDSNGNGRKPEFHLMDLNYGLKYGRVMTTDKVEGLSIWLPPGSTDVGLARMLRCGLVRGAIQMGWTNFRRFENLCGHLEEAHKKLMTGPHWYLYILAVDQEHQNKGLGSRLIAPGKAWADEAGLPLFLETLNHRALELYARHGFEVVHHGQPSACPQFWCLIRQPR